MQAIDFSGQKPSQLTLYRAAMFLGDELPIRLARRVEELENLPHGLSDMPSVIKVKNWYAESFQELIEFPKVELPPSMKHKLRGTTVTAKRFATIYTRSRYTLDTTSLRIRRTKTIFPSRRLIITPSLLSSLKA